MGDLTRAEHPGVPWSAARMRDRLVHYYFEIDLDVLWMTITTDLPALISALEVDDRSSSLTATAYTGCLATRTRPRPTPDPRVIGSVEAPPGPSSL